MRPNGELTDPEATVKEAAINDKQAICGSNRRQARVEWFNSCEFNALTYVNARIAVDVSLPIPQHAFAALQFDCHGVRFSAVCFRGKSRPSLKQPVAQHALGASADPILTMAPHSESAPYWVSGQANSIFQMHGHFHSPYEGANSLRNIFETKASEVATLYLGYQWHANTRYNTDFIVDFENAGGRGISQALGLAGVTNVDVVRNPNLRSFAIPGARRDSPDHRPHGRNDRPGSRPVCARKQCARAPL